MDVALESRQTRNSLKNGILIFLVGFCLSVTQFVMVRDFVTIIYGEEVAIILVTAAFFSGLSIGYLFSLKFSQRFFKAFALVLGFLHLTFPFSYRYLAVWTDNLGDEQGFVLLLLLFVYALIFSSLFAAFLPRLISYDNEWSPELRLKIFYTLELLGFCAGFAAVGWSMNKPVAAILFLYWPVLGAVLFLATGKRNWTIGYLVAGIIVSFYLDDLDKASSAYLYEKKHGKHGAKILYSVNSPYQKVEVIEDYKNEKYLYLDGLLNLNEGDLKYLNFYIARIPAELTRPNNALIIGNGTLSSAPVVYPFSQRLTSVELDPGVLNAGKRFFTSEDKLTPLKNWSLFVDDGKHFLWTQKELYDLIIMDIPSPLTIQEAVLHTREFYSLTKERLTEKGVLAVQLSGPLQKNNRTPARVTAALAEVFNEVMVIKSSKADRSFAYASRKLPFKKENIKGLTKRFEPRLKIISPDRVHRYLKRAVPLSINELDLVLRRGWERFTDRYFDYD